MNILEHLDELEVLRTTSSYIEARCPVCQGKLKISLSISKKGAYACYTNQCEKTRLIREFLYKPNDFKVKPVYKPLIVKTVRRFTRPTPFTNIDLDLFKTSVPYTPPLHKDNVTVYTYGSVRVWRKDIAPNIKVFKTQHYDNGTWLEGVGNNGIPIYHEKYIQPYIFIVEGEKCADFLHKNGYAAITISCSYTNETGYENLADRLTGSQVEGILYLRDNDEAGKRKADLCASALWSRKLPCKVVNVSDYYEATNPDAVDLDGFDVADVKDQLGFVLNYAIDHSDTSYPVFA